MRHGPPFFSHAVFILARMWFACIMVVALGLCTLRRCNGLGRWMASVGMGILLAVGSEYRQASLFEETAHEHQSAGL
jgi:hypothetical protein